MKIFNTYELSSFFKERKDQKIIDNMYETYKFIPIVIEEEVLENRNISKAKVEEYNYFYNMVI